MSPNRVNTGRKLSHILSNRSLYKISLGSLSHLCPIFPFFRICLLDHCSTWLGISSQKKKKTCMILLGIVQKCKQKSSRYAKICQGPDFLMTVMVLPWPDRLDTDWIPPGPFRTAIWMTEKDPLGEIMENTISMPFPCHFHCNLHHDETPLFSSARCTYCTYCIAHKDPPWCQLWAPQRSRHRRAEPTSRLETEETGAKQ